MALHEVNGCKLVYLDNAATSQKPIAVMKASQNYYEDYNSNVHRGIHSLSARATDKYELARKKIASFINLSNSSEIVFTRNATEAINLVAYSWGLQNLKQEDENKTLSANFIVIMIFALSNSIVHWQLVAQKTGAILKFVSLSKDEVPDINVLKEMFQNVKMFVDTAPEVEALMDTTLEVKAPINTSTLHETPTLSLSIHPEPLKKDVKCKLYVGQGGVVVALRWVVATKGNVHGKILALGNYRVVIDKCLDGSAKLPVSVGDGTTLVVHAVNSFVAWPSHLIISYDHE
ncbi:uncharacterized protein LOC133785916 [Humulus lupulus]|uniref:uncharacterized protein LOC133785916 n=1 Tax=Humulus lupulus TaxID=3486 RepID=UPI002B4078E5|nr:uncharacterized protein LOC133785916 [Humulus lupulus]